MLNWKRPKDEPSAVDLAVDQVVKEMQVLDADSAEFRRMSENLVTLMEAKAKEPKPMKISADTIVIATANIVGIVLILLFERTGTITSKALPFIPKPR